MEKIKMTSPIVEIDGDEMTRILWKLIKEELLLPYVELNTEYYDFSIQNRDATNDEVVKEAAYAIKKHKVGVKCATITANKARKEEYNLKNIFPSPNGTLRAILDGTVFRAPIIVEGLNAYVPGWKKPITIARHAYGDIYKAVDYKVNEAGKAKLVFEGESGKVTELPVFEYKGPGVLMGMHNVNASIESFARSCFKYALDTKQDVWFSAKDTISKIYDGEFKQIFEEIYEKEYKAEFEKAGITYFYTLIDDAIARVIKSEGGFVWACKNYDGDVMSDMIATAFGALAMMTSVLVSPDGYYEYEAAHGTVQRHYQKYLKGEETSTNPVATIFAWTGALRKNGELSENKELCDFADRLEKAVIRTIESGLMTKDLVLISGIPGTKALNTSDFIQAIKSAFEGLECEETSDDEKIPDICEKFFDAGTYKEKREILTRYKDEITDKMITAFAVSIDVVVDDGPFDARYYSLMRCLDQMAKFETTGLR